MARFGKENPKEWGERVTGVKTRIRTEEKIIALTFDLCGGKRGSGFDNELVAFLRDGKIPATFFISHGWTAANPAAFARLAADPLFEIANHGWSHRPASLNGRSAYGIRGTADAGELYDEIERNAADLAERTGKRPRFYRSGTGYCDEVAVRMANGLGQEVVGASLLGDAGATYTPSQVRSALLSARPGDIAVFHANHPESGTRQGVMEAVPVMLSRGYRFVRLSEAELD